MVGPPSFRMLEGWCSRAPPVDGKFYDRQVDHPDHGEQRRRPGAALRIVEGAGQRDMPEIQEQQDQHRRQSGVPHPPSAPHGLAPERSGRKGQRGKAGADRRSGPGQYIGEGMAPDEARRAQGRHDKIDEQRHPSRRDVDVHDAHALALLVVGRREDQRPRQADAEAEQRQRQTPGKHRAGEAAEARGIGETVEHGRQDRSGSAIAPSRRFVAAGRSTRRMLGCKARERAMQSLYPV